MLSCLGGLQKKHVFILTLMDLFFLSWGMEQQWCKISTETNWSPSRELWLSIFFFMASTQRDVKKDLDLVSSVPGKVTNVLICECKHHQDDKAGDNLVEGHNNFLFWGKTSHPRDEWQCDKFWLIGTTMWQVRNQWGCLRTSFFHKTFILDFH